MGLWADTFGGGNSFTESVANTFTKSDNKEYQGGSLVNTDTGKIVSGGAMDSTDTYQKNKSVGDKSAGHGEDYKFADAVGDIKDIVGNSTSTVERNPKAKDEDNKTVGAAEQTTGDKEKAEEEAETGAMGAERRDKMD